MNEIHSIFLVQFSFRNKTIDIIIIIKLIKRNFFLRTNKTRQNKYFLLSK